MLPESLRNKLNYSRQVFLQDYFEATACVGYAEPGYTDPEECEETGLQGLIVFANWNDVCMECGTFEAHHQEAQHPFSGRLSGAVKRMLKNTGITAEEQALLTEELGDDVVEDWFHIECEWSDEWGLCADCGRAIRKSPDGPEWSPSFLDVAGEGSICHECLAEDPDKYFDTVKNRAVNGSLIDPGQHGWIQVHNSYDGRWQNGLHSGMADDPSAQCTALCGNGYDVVFDFHNSQFYVEWCIYVKLADDHPDSIPEAMKKQVQQHVRELIDTCGECKMSPTPAEMMKAMLRDGHRQEVQLKDSPGITLMQPDTEDPSKAVVRKITPEEFADGSWARGED